MNRDKRIEEMARDICECFNNDGTCFQDDKPCDCKCQYFTDAQYLYEKGYRKASEVARETIEEAIEVVRHIFDEVKIRANNETNVLLRCQFRGEQIGASLVEYALAKLKKKYESEG
jgi:hypothetical protein